MNSTYFYKLILLIAVLLMGQNTFAQFPTTAEAEYFIDTDPGVGNATALVATDGSFSDAFEKITQSGLNFASAGTHTINVRVKNNAGIWSPVFTTVVTALTLQTIRIYEAEFYVDTDPGFGSGVTMLSFDGSFSDAFEKVKKDSWTFVTAGTHTLNVRVRNYAGVWSPVFTTVVTALSLQTIRIFEAEFYVDTDPGFGSGVQMLSFDGSFSDAFEKVKKDSWTFVSAGTHTLNVRVRNYAGNWSPVFTTVVTALSLQTIRIYEAEFYVDTDPGFGSGVQMLSFDGSFSDAFEKVKKDSWTFVTAGTHTLNVRVRNYAGNWSPVFTTVVTALSLQTIRIYEAEFYIDTDPGFGNGVQMLSFDGSFSDAFEKIKKDSWTFYFAGTHTLNVRVRNYAGNWSPVFTTVITALSLQSIKLTAAEYFWDTDPGEGNGTALLAFDNTFDNAYEKVYQNVVLNITGAHVLNVRVRNFLGNWSPVFRTVVVDTSSVPIVCDTVTISTPSTTVCSGTPVVFTATASSTSGAPVYHWYLNSVETGSNNAVFTADSVTNSDAIYCRVTSANCALTPALSNSIYMNVNAAGPAQVDFRVNVDSRFCEGISANISAGAEHAGDAPVFVWKLNWSIVQVDFPSFFFSVFYNHAFTNGDVLVIEMTSNDACATSSFATDTFVVTTEPTIIPVVTAIASDTIICLNDEVTFTATGHNEGYNHDFNWYLNGQSLFNYDSVYVTNTLVDGDYLWCEYSTRAYCASPVSVASEIFTMHVSCSAKTDETSTGIVEERTSELMLAVYPNPSNGKFYVKANGMKNKQQVVLKMYNATGEVVFSKSDLLLKENEPTEIDVNGSLVAGIYWLRIYSNEMEWKKPLVISGK